MTKQDKIDFKNPIAQNLFLLMQNTNFQNDLENLKKKHRKELNQIIEQRKSVAVITNQYGSNSLKQDIESIARKSPLFYRPQIRFLKSLIVFMVTGVNPMVFLRSVEKNGEVNTINADPTIEIKVNEEGVVIKILCSLYHTRSEVLEFISDHWPQVTQEQKELTKKTGFAQEKLQPFTDFERDWRIFTDKENNTYEELVAKYNLNDFSSASMIVSRLKNRIKNLYSR